MMQEVIGEQEQLPRRNSQIVEKLALIVPDTRKFNVWNVFVNVLDVISLSYRNIQQLI